MFSSFSLWRFIYFYLFVLIFSLCWLQHFSIVYLIITYEQVIWILRLLGILRLLFSPLQWKTPNFCLGGIWPDWCLLNISPATIDETTLTSVLPLTMTWYKVADWIFQLLFQHIFIWSYRMQLFNSVHSKFWNIFMFKTNFVYCHSCHLYRANFHLFIYLLL